MAGCLLLFLQVARAAENHDALFNKALKYFNKKDFRAGRRILQDLVRKEPQNALFWFNLGNSNLVLKQYGDAIQAYIMVIRLKSPLAKPAWLYLAKISRYQGKLDEANRILSQLAKKKLLKNLAKEVEIERMTLTKPYLERGTGFYRKRQYEKALEAFKVSAQARENDETRLMLGLSLLRLGRSEEAKSSFVKITNTSSDAEYRRYARNLLRQIKEKTWQRHKRYWGNVDLSLGYDSNTFGEGYSEEISSTATGSLGLDAGYRFIQERSYLLDASYALSWEEATGLVDNRVVGQTLTGRWVYKRNKWSFKSVPALSAQLLGREFFLYEAGVTLEIQKEWDTDELGISYQLTRNFPGGSAYDYLRGSVHTVTLYWGKYFKKQYLSVYYEYLAEAIGDLDLGTGILPLACSAHGLGVDADWYFLPSWTMSGRLGYRWKDYSNLAQPDGIERDDTELSISVEVLKALDRNLKLFLSGELTANSSTLGADHVDDKNFTQWVVRMGVAWDLVS